jgi:hypothetical protein
MYNLFYYDIFYMVCKFSYGLVRMLTMGDYTPSPSGSLKNGSSVQSGNWHTGHDILPDLG